MEGRIERELILASRTSWSSDVMSAVRRKDMDFLKLHARRETEFMTRLRTERNESVNETAAARRERDALRVSMGEVAGAAMMAERKACERLIQGASIPPVLKVMLVGQLLARSSS
jgi:hypothetical protein